MKFLIDMNLTPQWRDAFQQQGWESSHWSEIGEPQAPDPVIMRWALDRGHVVFTHDLDFSAILAATQMQGPSVVQVRSQDPMPDRLGRIVADSIRSHQAELERGAILVIEEWRSRVRILPIHPPT